MNHINDLCTEYKEPEMFGGCYERSTRCPRFIDLYVCMHIPSKLRCYVQCRIFLHDRPWISQWIKSISNESDITCHVFASQLSGHCDVFANRLWRHQQNVKRASETRGWFVKIPVLSVIYAFGMSCKKWNDVCTLVTNCLYAHSSVILVFIYLVAAQLGK